MADCYGVSTTTIENIVHTNGFYKQPSPELRALNLERQHQKVRRLRSQGLSDFERCSAWLAPRLTKHCCVRTDVVRLMGGKRRADAFPVFRVTHRGDAVADVVAAALEISQRFGTVAEQVERMQAKVISAPEQVALAERSLALRYWVLNGAICRIALRRLMGHVVAHGHCTVRKDSTTAWDEGPGSSGGAASSGE